jgi:hypothetical protein
MKKVMVIEDNFFVINNLKDAYPDIKFFSYASANEFNDELRTNKDFTLLKKIGETDLFILSLNILCDSKILELISLCKNETSKIAYRKNGISLIYKQ